MAADAALLGIDPEVLLSAGTFKRTVLQAIAQKARDKLDQRDQNQAKRIASAVGKLFG